MSVERWAPIPNWPYEVSDHGRVRNARNGHIRQTVTEPTGYRIVTLYDNAQRWKVRIHVLVARAFPHGDGTQVRHLDGDPGNNHHENLLWGTATENALDVLRHHRNANANKTHCIRGHDLINGNIRITAKGHRTCRDCIQLVKQGAPTRRGSLVGPHSQHRISFDYDLWHAAQTRAHDNGETVSDVVRRALTDYTTVPELEEEDA